MHNYEEKEDYIILNKCRDKNIHRDKKDFASEVNEFKNIIKSNKLEQWKYVGGYEGKSLNMFRKMFDFDPPKISVCLCGKEVDQHTAKLYLNNKLFIIVCLCDSHILVEDYMTFNKPKCLKCFSSFRGIKNYFCSSCRKEEKKNNRSLNKLKRRVDSIYKRLNLFETSINNKEKYFEYRNRISSLSKNINKELVSFYISSLKIEQFEKKLDKILKKLEDENIKVCQICESIMNQNKICCSFCREIGEKGNVEIISFGKYKNKTFKYVYNNDEEYCNWVLNQSFSHLCSTGFNQFVIYIKIRNLIE